jgi:hypothetical protein
VIDGDATARADEHLRTTMGFPDRQAAADLAGSSVADTKTVEKGPVRPPTLRGIEVGIAAPLLVAAFCLAAAIRAFTFPASTPNAIFVGLAGIAIVAGLLATRVSVEVHDVVVVNFFRTHNVRRGDIVRVERMRTPKGGYAPYLQLHSGESIRCVALSSVRTAWGKRRVDTYVERLEELLRAPSAPGTA